MTITITREQVDADNYKTLTIKGISKLVQNEVRIYGVFERVPGGVEYSAENDEHFDDLFTDDLNHLLREAVIN